MPSPTMGMFENTLRPYLLLVKFSETIFSYLRIPRDGISCSNAVHMFADSTVKNLLIIALVENTGDILKSSIA